jgi:hypothetical protein
MKEIRTITLKSLSLAIVIMGVIHIAATFTPVIFGKLELVAESARQAFVYMSLMCGALLVSGGTTLFLLIDKVKEIPFLHRPIIITETILIVDGILAVCMMPANPCAWILLLLTLPFICNKPW